MSQRSYTIKDYLRHRLDGHKPPLACSAETPEQFRDWRRQFIRRFRKALRRRPESVPLNPETLMTRSLPGGVRAEKIVFNSSPAMSVPAWVLMPDDGATDIHRPAVFLIPGHTGNDVEPHGRVVDTTSGKAWGVGLNPDGSPCSTRYHNDIGQALARAGFLVYCQDFLGFGERAGTPEYMRNLWNHACNLVGQALVIFDEIDLSAVHYHDVVRGIDYLASRADIDPRRIGMMGCSLGGMWTNNVAALERRVRVAVSCCSYSNLESHIFRKKLGLCAAQTVPGLAAFADLTAPLAAIAPKPLMMQVGRHDPGMAVEEAAAPCREVERLYAMLGREERCAVDIFDGGHEIHVPAVIDWFRRWL